MPTYIHLGDPAWGPGKQPVRKGLISAAPYSPSGTNYPPYYETTFVPLPITTGQVFYIGLDEGRVPRKPGLFWPYATAPTGTVRIPYWTPDASGTSLVKKQGLKIPLQILHPPQGKERDCLSTFVVNLGPQRQGLAQVVDREVKLVLVRIRGPHQVEGPG